MSTNNLTIGSIIIKTVPFFKERALPNPRLEADLLLAGVLKVPRIKLYSDWDRPLEPGEIQQYREAIVKRVQGWPLAYLTGKKSFLSWEFDVTPAVLIPRPETEILVETVVDLVRDRQELCGVDVGTGSGNIAITLAKLLPGSKWYAIDLSPEALTVAEANAAQLGVDRQISFLKGDLLDPIIASSDRCDIVVSNPPYVPSATIGTLQPEVRREPPLALDGGPDGLDIYRKLLPQAKEVLTDDGICAVEHGWDQRDSLEKLFKDSGFISNSIPDLAGLDRIIIGRKNVPTDKDWD
jgi:release factor glutamine methyltransferase